MTDIPLIGTNVSLKDGKEKSINPTIKRVNQLDGDLESIEADNKSNLEAYKKQVNKDIKKVDDKINLANGKATTALSNSENTQKQLDTVIDLSGTEADPRVSQALIDVEGKTWTTLKARLDTEQEKLIVDSTLWSEIELLAKEYDDMQKDAEEEELPSDDEELPDPTEEESESLPSGDDGS